MALQKISFRPGIVRDVSSFGNEGGWYDCNLVRFRNGLPQSVGGWQKYVSSTFLGTCRAIIQWISLDLSNYIGIGTTCKYYILDGTVYSDITPIRRTVTLTAWSSTQPTGGPFTTTATANILNVYDVAHGATVNDYVTYSGATGLGGNVTATVLNQEYKITDIVDDNNYQITLSVNANASDTGHGGTVTAAYQINVGLDTQVGGNGWGAGTWGRGGWGSAATVSAGNTLRLWSHDNYGEDLIFNVRGGGIYYWTASTGTSVRGYSLESVSTDPTVPTLANQVIVSDRDRHVLVFGANPDPASSQDPMLIRFSDAEDPFTWSPTATNSAGDLRLGSGSYIVRALETKREILVWTDNALYSLQYIGAPYTFSVTQIASSITSVGYNGFVTVDDNAMWMGLNKFYIYSGQTNELKCTVLNHVFTDINLQQSDKIMGTLNSEFNEVTWFYPSASSEENDSYVTYNYSEQVWTYGSLSRTAWLDRGINHYPIAAATDNTLYQHEYGTDDGSTTPSTALNPYIESSQFSLGSGDDFAFTRRIIPDLTFINSTNSPQAIMTIKTQNFPGSNYNGSNASTVSQTATVPIEQFTDQAFIRLRGRQVTFRVESDKVGTRWSLGVPRLEVQADGRR